MPNFKTLFSVLVLRTTESSRITKAMLLSYSAVILGSVKGLGTFGKYPAQAAKAESYSRIRSRLVIYKKPQQGCKLGSIWLL